MLPKDCTSCCHDGFYLMVRRVGCLLHRSCLSTGRVLVVFDLLRRLAGA